MPAHASQNTRRTTRWARHQRVVVENLSHATGVGPGGEAVTVRLRGEDGAVAALAGKHRATFAGSLPWADDHHGLARTEQLRTVAAVVTANLNDSSYD